MEPTFISLHNIRIPGVPDTPLLLEGAPLRIIDAKQFTEHLGSNITDFSCAVGIATVLYNWCPNALYALLDETHWLSMTWILTLPDETKIEIGRIRDQVTFGTLDKEGLWKLMVTFNTSRADRESGNGDGIEYEGRWIPNTLETMLDGHDIDDPVEVDRLGRLFVRDLILQQRWLSGRALKHEFFIESADIGGMDPWQDGIAMNPHWLYSALDLARCTNCGVADSDGKSLNRCGRCGTAAYCSSTCQKEDWPVHKAVCSMSMEDRGKALHLTKNGGLVHWSKRDKVKDDAQVEDLVPNKVTSFNMDG